MKGRWPACFLLLLSSVHAQDCLPAAKTQELIPAPIHAINFSCREQVLSQETISDISSHYRAEVVNAASVAQEMTNLAEEATERFRAAYQNQGYFKVKVTAHAAPSEFDKSQYDIYVVAGAAGKQYRLGNLNIVGATLFPTQQLLDLFTIRPGEIFSRQRIAEGLEALQHLYGSNGYVNYTGVPETQFDDNNVIAHLTINVDEGKQFRMGSVSMLGLKAETKTRVLSELDLKPGDIFNQVSWQSSLRKLQNLAPNPDPNTPYKLDHSKLDEQDGLVDVVLDFRKPSTCLASSSESR